MCQKKKKQTQRKINRKGTFKQKQKEKKEKLKINCKLFFHPNVEYFLALVTKIIIITKPICHINITVLLKIIKISTSNFCANINCSHHAIQHICTVIQQINLYYLW